MKDKQVDESIPDTEQPIEEEANSSEEKPDVYTSIQQQFNDLRSEYLDARSKSINRWLGFISIVLIFFTILIPIITGIAAYFVYDRFGDLQEQMQIHVKTAQQHSSDSAEKASDAAKYLKEIKEHHSTVKGIVAKLTSKDFTNPNKVEVLQSTIEDILKNPSISLEDKAIIEAYRLQKEDKLSDAIEKWRSIANTAKGVNDELVARSFFSIGFLHSQLNENDQAVSAFDQAIALMPNFADAYTSRGVVKSALGVLDDAIVDHSEAIRLNPDFVEAYINRGTAKRALNQHAEAISDFDEAIRLDVNSPVAYTLRGVSKGELGRHAEAVADHNEAIKLNPSYVDAYINRGSAKRALGDMDGWKKDMDKALDLTKELKEGGDDE